MRPARSVLVCIGVVATLSLRSAHAAGGGADEARTYLDKAATASALAHYDVAAENFEKAFELKPDPAVLYRAAEAHDLAGNKPRALALYQSYLRTYGDKDRDERAKIEARIEDLQRADGQDEARANPVPVRTEPRGGGAVGGSRPDPVSPGPAFPAPSAEIQNVDGGNAIVDPGAELAARRHHRVAGLVVSLVGAGVGTVVFVYSGLQEAKAQSDYNAATTQAQKDALASTGRNYSLLKDISIGFALVCGAGIAISAVSLALLPKERKTAFVLTPALGPGLAGGVATFRF